MTSFCDAHLHVVAPVGERPMLDGRSYTPRPAPLARFLSLARPLGIDRCVIVQPSFYGDDNTVLLESLSQMDGHGRGVAVLDPQRTDPSRLPFLHRAGVRGVRLNLYSPGAGIPAAIEPAFAALEALAGTMGWHVEVLAPLPVIVRAAALLARSRVTVVIDHYGLPGDAPPNGPDGRALLALLGLPHVWVKLSAPYRCWGDSETIQPDRRWLRALLEVAPDRCVWGSDWPHTPSHSEQRAEERILPYRRIDYARLLDALRAALPRHADWERIMGRQPAALYGFDD